MQSLGGAHRDSGGGLSKSEEHLKAASEVGQCQEVRGKEKTSTTHLRLQADRPKGVNYIR